MNRASLVLLSALSALTGLALLHCDDDDPVANTPQQPDASTVSEAGPDVMADPRPKFSNRLWKPQVLALNVRPQPNAALFPDAPGNDPGFSFPLVVVNNESANPKRKPDAYVDSKNVGGIGFGCVGYKFSPANPADPKGANRTHGDMGTVTVGGYTGGNYIFGPPNTPLPKPITCTRAEGFPGVFAYSCAGAAPVTNFLSVGDMVTMKASGGADLKAWEGAVPAPPNTDFTVTNNLWEITPDMVDGSKDLRLDYKCGGATCGKAGFIAVNIVTSDAEREAGPDPFDFPRPQGEFGFVDCIDFLGFNGDGFTVPKEVLAQIPASWKHLQITLGTANAGNDQVDEQPTTFGAGFTVYAITHR